MKPYVSVCSTIGNEDIEEILRKSEQKTAELENKYKSLGLDDLQKLTVTSDGMAYKWEGEDFRKKAGIGMSWIGPSKRERKETSYRSAQGFPIRQSKEKVPRPKNAIQVQDFQFFPPRLQELQEKERYALWKEVGFKPSQPENADYDMDHSQWAAEESDKVDAAEPLTEEELKERDDLAQQGLNWSKREFQAFCKAMEKHGRSNIERIAAEIEGKTLDEVKSYAAIFWERYRELSDHERILANVEKGEVKLRKIQDVQDLLTAKIANLRLPLQELKIPYNQSKGKNYTEEEDRFLLVLLEKFGYGTEEVYDKIRYEVRRSPIFRFDWFLKSRTSQELSRRCGTLITMMSKEPIVDMDVGDDRKRKGREEAVKGSKKKK